MNTAENRYCPRTDTMSMGKLPRLYRASDTALSQNVPAVISPMHTPAGMICIRHMRFTVNIAAP